MTAAPIPRTEPERLKALVAYEILDTAAEEVFDTLTKLAASACDVPIALISLIDSNRQWFKSVQGLPGVTETSRDIAFCAHAILQPGLMEVPDARKDPRFSDNPLVSGEPGIRFYAGMPLVNPQGHALGTLCVIDRKPRSLAPSQRSVLSELARLVVSLMEAGKSRMEVRRAQTAAEEGETRCYSVAELYSDWYWEQDEGFRFTKCVDIGEQSDFDANECLGKTPAETPSYEMTTVEWEGHKRILEERRPFHNVLLKR